MTGPPQWQQPPPPQPPPPQQPLPPPKKSHKTLWIVLAAVILPLVLLASCIGLLANVGSDVAGSPSSDVATSDEPAPDASTDKPKPKPEPTTKTYSIGQHATDGDYQFTVTKIKCDVSRVGDQYANEKAQGQFCLVSLKIKNVGNDAINFSSENQALIDTRGKTYSADDAAWIYLDTDPFREINPDNTMSTVVPFDISKKAKPDYLLLKAGTFGFAEGVRVKL
jgi:hypothetical protein